MDLNNILDRIESEACHLLKLFSSLNFLLENLDDCFEEIPYKIVDIKRNFLKIFTCYITLIIDVIFAVNHFKEDYLKVIY